MVALWGVVSRLTRYLRLASLCLGIVSELAVRAALAASALVGGAVALVLGLLVLASLFGLLMIGLRAL